VNIASDVGRRPSTWSGLLRGEGGARQPDALSRRGTEARARERGLPGPVVTGDWGAPAIRKAAGRTLAGRTGLPEEVASAVLFAVKCGYLNGPSAASTADR